MTARRPFTMFAAAIFLLIALAHLYRLIVGFDVSAQKRSILVNP